MGSALLTGPPNKLPAIAIGVTGPNQLHVGILYMEGGECQMLDQVLAQGTGTKLRKSPFKPGKYSHIPLALPEERVDQISAHCRQVFELNEFGIPYGFSPPIKVFNDDNTLNTEEIVGLTCATFIIGVLQRIGIHLVRVEDWPLRTADLTWMEKFVREILAKLSIADSTHINRVKNSLKEQNVVRVKPSEVAAGAECLSEKDEKSYGEPPFSFEVIDPVGARIEKELIERDQANRLDAKRKERRKRKKQLGRKRR